MAAPVFIGDEASAAGYRLAGFEVDMPKPGGAAAALARALERADLVFITAALSREIPERDLDAALRSVSPMVLMVPDINGTVQPPDMHEIVRQMLGLEA